jgi:two-component system OmpR family sensor kinase
MVILIPLSAIIAWLTLARSLRPIATLRREISARHGDNLAPIHAEELPSELAAIAKSVNSLMRRLDMALDAEKEFTANAAHELRTPIAGALAQTERLIAEARGEDGRKRPLQIKAALSDLADLSEKLMQLARADAGVAVAGKPADLAAVAALVAADFEQHSQNKDRLRLETLTPGKVYAAIDTDALAIVLRNLIENALRHGVEGTQVIVRIDDASLSVINEGPIVQAPSGLTKRFERGATRAEGSGLGLAIVSRILQQIDATLILNSPASGRQDGFEAKVRFPRA